jgi:hypothetical protein
MTTISGTPRRITTRALAVGGAVLGPVLLWVFAQVLNIDLFVDPRNGQPAGPVPLSFIIGFALGAALLGWAALAVLERFTRRAATIWTALAVAVLLLSFVPLFGVGATAGTKTILALMHVAVAAVLIPVLLRRPSPARP